MARESIPKGIKEKVLDEHDHRCAVCGESRPHLHHIDEDATNNEIENLLPLCPNHHLTDQHNPTRRIDIPKLLLFRRYKDPAILLPQFHPIYTRQLFLENISLGQQDSDDLHRKAMELVEFVSEFEMGDFYSKRIKELVSLPSQLYIPGEPDFEFERKEREQDLKYRSKLIKNREELQSLLVELLRYQSWANIDQRPDRREK